MKRNFISFGSDNHAGVHPMILRFLSAINRDETNSYGGDPYTERANALFRKLFGKETKVYFVWSGTAANTLALASLMRPYHTVLCAANSHLEHHECGASERFSGCKLTTFPTENGKINPDAIARKLESYSDEHVVQPKVISITQPTECGTIYSEAEVRSISRITRKHGLLLHMDGARIANAAVALGKGFREITSGLGVDVLSFGGTKNGLLGAEAVVFLNPRLGNDFRFVRKQGMQLSSKMRFLSGQFIPYLEKQRWADWAAHANQMARRLHQKLNLPTVYPVQTNAVFVRLSKTWVRELRKDFYFYEPEREGDPVRLMTNFQTKGADVDAFLSCLRSAQRTSPPAVGGGGR